MKKNLIAIIIFVLLLAACGQEGTLHVYLLQEKRQVVDSLIFRFYENNPKYLPTNSWQDYVFDIKDRVPFMKFYFLQNKNEMYVLKFSTSNQFTYEKDSLKNCRIAIYGVYKFSKKYQKIIFMQAQNLSEIEMKQIQNTFEKEFLKKLNVDYKLLDFWERNSD